jgi:hypothetical protein
LLSYFPTSSFSLLFSSFDCSPVYFFLYFYFHFSFLSPCIFPFFVVSFLSLILFLLFVVFCNFLPYLCKKKFSLSLVMFLRHFKFILILCFFSCFVMSFPSLICSHFLFSFYVSSLFPVYPYFVFFFVCVFCYVLLSTFNLFPFLVLFSYMSVFLSFVSPCVHQFLTSPISLTAAVSTGQLLPVASFVEYPQQVDLEHLRMDHKIWPFQAESGRHARLVSISDNTV